MRLTIRILAAGVGLAALCAPALAGWKEEVGVLRIGLVARPGSGAAIAGATAIERAYSQALGVPARIFVARDYAALIDAQAAGRVDYAVYTATAYATAWLLCGCVEPLAAPAALDGSDGIRAVLITRKAGASGPRRLAIWDDGGAVAALAQPAAIQGYERVQAANAADAEAMLSGGAVDALWGWVPDRPVGGSTAAGGSLARLAESGVDPDDLEVAWTSSPLRFGPHAVRKDLPEAIKASLRTFTTTLMMADPDVYDFLESEHQGGFSLVSHDGYAAAIEMVEAVAASREPL